jgi:hypothetical protein
MERSTTLPVGKNQRIQRYKYLPLQQVVKAQWTGSLAVSYI